MHRKFYGLKLDPPIYYPAVEDELADFCLDAPPISYAASSRLIDHSYACANQEAKNLSAEIGGLPA